MKILLDGNSLTISDAVEVAKNGATVGLSAGAKKRMERSRTWVEQAVRERKTVYGITTGFGSFQNVSIPTSQLHDLQRNLILSHCAGVGPPFPEDVVRAMMLLRANALAKGCSGIRVSTVETLLRLLNRHVHPFVPSQGSVGASGDLAPLSHIAAVLIGEGEAFVEGKLMSGGDALSRARIKAVRLEAKEGIALNNGTQAMTAVGLLALHEAEQLVDLADAVAAMTLEALEGKGAPFANHVQHVRPHPGQATSARNIRSMIQGSRLVDLTGSKDDGRVQDSYAIRCVPQVHGASRDALAYVRRVLEIEINSATDNPLIFPEDDISFSAGNFHGQPVALAMDFLSLASAELGNISERRTAKLLDKNHNSGLPAFLADNGGLQSGLMIAQYTAAALVSENKVLIHPASGDSIPTSANQEDHVSMGTIAARHARQVVENVRRVLAIELLCASQALDLRGGKPGKGSEQLFRSIRSIVPQLKNDRALSHDIERLSAAIADGSINVPVHSRK
jgi:histidine ammonia-lyase